LGFLAQLIENYKTSFAWF